MIHADLYPFGERTIAKIDEFERVILRLAGASLLGDEGMQDVLRSAPELASKLYQMAQGMDLKSEIVEDVRVPLKECLEDTAKYLRMNVGEVTEQGRKWGEDAARRCVDQLQRTPLGMVNGAQRAYVKYGSEAVANVVSGMKSIDKAVEDAVRKMARRGIRTLDYRADGRIYRANTDSAVRTTIRTQVTQAAYRQELEIAQLTGNDLVEVSSCGNARPSHAEWEGDVYSLSGETPGYEKFEQACLVGDPVDGFGGYNCDHTISIYNEAYGRRYEDALKGTGYTHEQAYALHQKQRYYEREIRACTREVNACKDLGLDASKAKARLAMREQQIKGLVGENGRILRRQTWREQVYA